MTTIVTLKEHDGLDEAARMLAASKKAVALTGAGISVESGIDDFRSPGGLWERYPPEEYATFEAFHRNPQKVWGLFHLMGRTLQDKKPNFAHQVLAVWEKQGLLKGIVTQNIDTLHQRAGSRNVVEIHGDAASLHCLQCGYTEPFVKIKEGRHVPLCPLCDTVLKPNVVLFGEEVRKLDEASGLLHGCDMLLVIGTSAQVYPAAAMPQQVKMQGGRIFEFNREATSLTGLGNRKNAVSDILFQGRASEMLRILAEVIAA